MVVIATWNVENLYRPGEQADRNGGPRDEKTYRAKLAALAKVIADMRPDVLALQEIGDELALADLAAILEPDLGRTGKRAPIPGGDDLEPAECGHPDAPLVG